MGDPGGIGERGTASGIHRRSNLRNLGDRCIPNHRDPREIPGKPRVSVHDGFSGRIGFRDAPGRFPAEGTPLNCEGNHRFLEGQLSCRISRASMGPGFYNIAVLPGAPRDPDPSKKVQVLETHLAYQVRMIHEGRGV